jgi:hypothetical protein
MSCGDVVDLDAVKSLDSVYNGSNTPAKIYRKCLRCQKNFRSESATNRICILCAKENEKYTAHRVYRVVNNVLNGVDRLETGVMGR